MYSWWALIYQEKGIFYLVNSLLKFNFDCYSCPLLFLYKAYQQIDSHMVKSIECNGLHKDKLTKMFAGKIHWKKALPLNWNKYRITFIIKITMPYVWRFLFNILGSFVPNKPHHTWLNDCETIMNVWGWCCGTSNFT